MGFVLDAVSLVIRTSTAAAGSHDTLCALPLDFLRLYCSELSGFNCPIRACAVAISMRALE